MSGANKQTGNQPAQPLTSHPLPREGGRGEGSTLLIELRTEELPPKSLRTLSEAFAQGVFASLREQGFCGAASTCTAYATPRRLALRVSGVVARQDDRVVERKGPAVAGGVDAAGKPTKALEGFMRSAGVAFADLQRLHDGKAEYFVARSARTGEPLAAHLEGIVAAALKKLPIPKLMRWGDSEHQFVRPVHGLVMLLGAELVPGSVLGVTSGRQTRGHRFLSNGPLTVGDADEYESLLEEQGAVIPSFAKRRQRIAAQLDRHAADLESSINPAEGLLDEVTALVEWPAVYVGSFEAEYLEVPQECLILTMQQNQKYFPLLDGAGRLMNRFLIVSNMQVADPRHIVGGNQRVVRPRLADARFFFKQDRRTSLASRLERLAHVVYHNRLGSQHRRVERLEGLALKIAGRLHASGSLAARAARLAKADLVTDMVGEFPELQGIMGRYYALSDGEDPVVADAIAAHYQPRFAGDALPQGNVACAVALADKIDALVGFFGIGQLPTGDKDPFGLRRAALGVLRILMETPLPLDLVELIGDAAANFPDGVLQDGFEVTLHDFMLERLRGYLREGGGIGATHAAAPAAIPAAVEAVLASRPARIDRVPARLAAVLAFVALPEAAALAAANKRIGNILKKVDVALPEIDVALLQEPAERALFDCVVALAPRIRSLVANEDYADALQALAAVRGPVDRFFDDVMVMVDEPLLRANRLALLAALGEQLNAVADISRLVIEK